MSLSDLLLGRPLASCEQSERKIGVIAGVPALGLDGLSSAAYGPEAALTMLLPLGAAGLYYIGPMLRANHWECTAVQELRVHAEALARHIAARAGTLQRGTWQDQRLVVGSAADYVALNP